MLVNSAPNAKIDGNSQRYVAPCNKKAATRQSKMFKNKPPKIDASAQIFNLFFNLDTKNERAQIKIAVKIKNPKSNDTNIAVKLKATPNATLNNRLIIYPTPAQAPIKPSHNRQEISALEIFIFFNKARATAKAIKPIIVIIIITHETVVL